MSFKFPTLISNLAPVKIGVKATLGLLDTIEKTVGYVDDLNPVADNLVDTVYEVVMAVKTTTEQVTGTLTTISSTGASTVRDIKSAIKNAC